MPGDKRDRLNLARAYSIGFNFVAAFGVFALIGYWVDSNWDSSPWGLIVGATLGLIGGMYNLIRQSAEAFKPPKPPDQGSNDNPPGEP